MDKECGVNQQPQFKEFLSELQQWFMSMASVGGVQ